MNESLLCIFSRLLIFLIPLGYHIIIPGRQTLTQILRCRESFIQYFKFCWIWIVSTEKLFLLESILSIVRKVNQSLISWFAYIWYSELMIKICLQKNMQLEQIEIALEPYPIRFDELLKRQIISSHIPFLTDAQTLQHFH